MQAHLKEIYTQHLLNAVIEEKKELAIKMIEHGASIFSEQGDKVDAIYLCLDLNHLDMLNTILDAYHKKNGWHNVGIIPEYLFNHYFNHIFKQDNVSALSIFDKHGFIDFAINFDPKPDRYYKEKKKEALEFSDMFKLGATKSIVYCHDKLDEIEWITSLSQKIQYDFLASSYNTRLLSKQAHLEFVHTMKDLNSDGFELALLNALLSVEKITYLERNDHNEKNPSFLHLITNYFEVGVNPHVNLTDLQIPKRFKQKEAYPKLSEFYKRMEYNQAFILKTRPYDTFLSNIQYAETKIAIEKHIMEKATLAVMEDNRKTLKI
jgi:hypothetical protein